MCNLYSHMRSQAEVRSAARAMRDGLGNLIPQPGIYPDYSAPIARTGADGVRELAMARWGMPSSRKAIFEATTKRADRLRARGQPVDFDQLLRMEPDGGTTNVRNTASSHWKRWLGVENRCLVPFSSFSEPGADAVTGRSEPWWFAFGEERPLAFFAGVWAARDTQPARLWAKPGPHHRPDAAEAEVSGVQGARRRQVVPGRREMTMDTENSPPRYSTAAMLMIALALSVAVSAFTPAQAQRRCHAIDGDTLACGTERVRIMGLDTP